MTKREDTVMERGRNAFQILMNLKTPVRSTKSVTGFWIKTGAGKESQDVYS